MTENSVTPTASSATRKAALWIAAVFILGTALGGTSGYLFGHRVSAAAPQLSDEAKRHQKVAALTDLLALSPEQQTQIDAIFADTQGQFQAVHKQSDAQMEVIRQAGRDKIRALLTAGQLPKFEEFLRKLDADRRNRQPSH